MGNNNNKRKQANKSSNNKSTSRNKSNNNNNIKEEKFVFVEDDKFDKTELLELDFDDTELLDFSDDEVNTKDEKDNKTVVSNKKDNKTNIEWTNNRSMLVTCLVVLCAFVVGFSACLLFKGKNVEVVTKTETKIVSDENIVFLGDSIFWMYDVEKYFEGMNVVNSGISGHKTTDVLDDMKNRVYKYNPSDIFIMIGTNDVLDSELSNEDTIENVGKIIDAIKENRPYTNINVISIFPVNRTDDEKVNHSMVYTRNNEDIQIMNTGIKKVCKEKKVTYINVYDLLLDEEGNLKIDYTTDGLHITSDGYEIITNKLKEYLD